MTTLSKRPSAHLIQSIPKMSMDEITLAGGKFTYGEVLGMTNDKHTKLDANESATESNVALGICFSDVDATTEDKPGLAHKRLTTVAADKLIWPETATDAQKAAWTEELEANFIIVR